MARLCETLVGDKNTTSAHSYSLEPLRKRSCCPVQVLVVDLFATGSPGGEREVDEDGGGDVGLVHDHRAGLDDGTAQTEGLWQVVVFGALALGKVEARVDADAGVAGDALLDPAGALDGRPHEDNVIHLQIVVLVDEDIELQRRCGLGTQDEPNW